MATAPVHDLQAVHLQDHNLKRSDQRRDDKYRKASLYYTNMYLVLKTQRIHVHRQNRVPHCSTQKPKQ
jgi:hypothetical protein